MGQINVRLSEVHEELLKAIVDKLIKDGINTNKTDVIQKAIYSYANDYVLPSEDISKIIDKHYKGF